MKHNHITVTPSPQDLLRLPLANAGVYTLTDAQIVHTRAQIYSLNANHVKGWKWRTTKLPHMVMKKTKLVRHSSLFTLLVWRVA